MIDRLYSYIKSTHNIPIYMTIFQFLAIYDVIFSGINYHYHIRDASYHILYEGSCVSYENTNIMQLQIIIKEVHRFTKIDALRMHLKHIVIEHKTLRPTQSRVLINE